MARTTEQLITEISTIVGGALDSMEIESIAGRVVEFERAAPPASSELAPVFLTDMNGRLVELYSEGHTPPPASAGPFIAPSGTR